MLNDNSVDLLYPEIEAHESGMLTLDALHRMYWEVSGNPQGIPVLFLHGGPGAGSSPKHRRFFDPLAYRVVIFDQRGAGRSTPLRRVSSRFPGLESAVRQVRRSVVSDT